MIKVNLLPTKKKRKAKPVPPFIVAAVFITLAAVGVLVYVNYYFGARLSSKKEQVAQNERRIAELKEKIKAVEDYEKRNAAYQQRKDIIEQLSKGKTLPVSVLDEVSMLLPPGVWFNTLTINGPDISIGCTAFTNTDVVNYVNNLKNSRMFADVYLQESVQSQASGFSVYTFRLTFKVKV